MATTNNLRPTLHRKQWEICGPMPVATGAGIFFRCLDLPAYLPKPFAVTVTAMNQQFLYDVTQDAYLLLPASAIAGAVFGAGACGRIVPTRPSATATGGSTTTIITALTLPHDLRGYKVRITAGPGAGDERTITVNTIGATSTITVGVAFSAAITAASVFVLLTPCLYYFCPGATAVGFARYDFALNTWTNLVVTGLPTAWTIDGCLVATPGPTGGSFETSAGKTFGSATTTVLTLSAGSAWTASQWISSQIRITGGTGAGQVRTISANTGLTLTVGTTFTTAPDATSTWVIEGNDDFLYLLGNNAVTLYRYSISANTWSTLAPVAARSGAPGAGMSAGWIYKVTDSAWISANAILNGRYIYSFRGAAGAVLDRYDIAGNTWTSGIAYGLQGETFTTGSCWEYDDADYIYCNQSGGLRNFRFSIALNRLEPWATGLYPQGAAVVGDKLFNASFFDGATQVKYLYHAVNTSTVLQRMMVIG